MDVWTVAFSTDSRHIATGSHNGKINIFNIDDGKKETVLGTTGKFTMSIAYVRHVLVCVCVCVCVFVYVYMCVCMCVCVCVFVHVCICVCVCVLFVCVCVRTSCMCCVRSVCVSANGRFHTPCTCRPFLFKGHYI